MADRRIEISTPEGWRAVDGLLALRAGDVFRMFGDDGKPVADAADGATRWRAVSVSVDAATGDAVVETETVPPTAAEVAAMGAGYFPGGASSLGGGAPPPVRGRFAASRLR